jgi:hypothetical protein
MSGKLRLNGATSGYSELQAPDVAGDQTFTLPAVGGELMVTGGSGDLWDRNGTALKPANAGDHVELGDWESVGSGLGMLIAASGQINLNRVSNGIALQVAAIGSSDPTIQLKGNGEIIAKDVITSTRLTGSGTRPVYTDSSGGLTVSSSDRTLKSNINTLPSQVEQVKALNPVSFNWRNKERLGEGIEIGFIAQEVEQVVPEVVRLNADGTLALDYPKLTATLTSALQTALTRIEALEAEVSLLKGATIS